ncbi:hypothetical protein TNCV_690621 [Trichonephila clavipes]|nr:hypothetical protein TNCV_690621 [Trichonephila clavipes]
MGMKIHSDETRYDIQSKNYTEIQSVTPKQIFLCPAFSPRALKLGLTPLMDPLQEILYSSGLQTVFHGTLGLHNAYPGVPRVTIKIREEINLRNNGKKIQPLTIKFGEQSCNINVDEILPKVTLLSFETVTSRNYAPLISSIHVLETLQEVFFWDGVQKPCHVSLHVRNIVNINNTAF